MDALRSPKSSDRSAAPAVYDLGTDREGGNDFFDAAYIPTGRRDGTIAPLFDEDRIIHKENTVLIRTELFALAQQRTTKLRSIIWMVFQGPLRAGSSEDRFKMFPEGIVRIP